MAKKVFEGLLENFDENSVTIKTDDKLSVFEKKQIAHIVPVIDFNFKGDKND